MLLRVAVGCVIVGSVVVVDGVDGFVDGVGSKDDVVRSVELAKGLVGVGRLFPGAWVPFAVVDLGVCMPVANVVPGVCVLVVNVVPGLVVLVVTIVLRIVVEIKVGALVEVGRTLHEQGAVGIGFVLKGGSVGLPAVSRSEIQVPLVSGKGPVGGGRT